jgi:hypothetical protein
MIAQTMRPRLIRAVDHIAECLDELADDIPDPVQAEIWRKAAEFHRGLSNPTMVRVWEEPSS